MAAVYPIRLDADSQIEPDPETEAIVEKYLKDIHQGNDMPQALISELYFHTAGLLLGGYRQGYEKAFFSTDWASADNQLIARVQANIFAFSGAKTYAEMKELRDLVYKDGKLTPWADFRRAARQINAKYNRTYLETERQAVIAAGTQGSRWVEIESTRGTHPYLEYVTARDSHVRPEHAALDGIILPEEDPFWQSYYPPNGWNCRCSTRRLTQREAEHRTRQYENRTGTPMPSSDTAQKRGGQATDKIWRHNVGTSEVIDTSHPYFRASKAAKELQLGAVRNYGMRPVASIYDRPSRLATPGKGLATKEEYAAFWEQMERSHAREGFEGFVLTDMQNGIMAHFDHQLRDKLESRGRFGFFDEAAKVFTQPDEVWGIVREGKKAGIKREYFNAYIRYYQDTPMLLIIDGAGRVDSFYKWERGLENMEQWRMGVLKYKKR